MHFSATCVTCDVADGVMLLGLADDAVNPQAYILLQRDMKPSDDNEGTHLEVCSQARSAYDAIAEVQLFRNRLALKLRPAAAGLGIDESIEVDFQLPEGRFQEIAEQLRAMFGTDGILVKLDP